MTHRLSIVATATLLLAGGLPAAAEDARALAETEWSGYVELEGRLFAEPPAWPGQRRQDASVAVQPEFEAEGPEGARFTFVPFARLDAADPNRSHADLREAFVHVPGETWAVGAGFGKVFWGVTESQHLVDIVNQADRVENPDLEDKLGQPMATLSLTGDAGTLDLFYLPWFREQTFPARPGRLRPALPVDEDEARVDRNTTPADPDLAVRFSRSTGGWDYGLHFFRGLARDPVLLPRPDAAGRPELVPYYDLIRQWGLDAQYTTGPWLWKFEGIRRSGQKDRLGRDRGFAAYVAGVEYLLPQVFGTDVDLTLVGEFLHDTRGGDAVTAFENDLFVGLRFALNDPASTTGLISLTQDLDTPTRLLNIEGSRRLTDRLTVNLEARFFLDADGQDLLWNLRRDDHVQVALRYYF